MPESALLQWFPSLKWPVVISAPMLGVANGKLASAVSKVGGLGFIAGGFAFESGSAQLRDLEQSLQDAFEHLGPQDGDLLPVGVGLITCHPPSYPHFATGMLPLLEKYRVCSLWLFAPAPGDPEGNSIHAQFIDQLRQRGQWGQRVKVWVQVGTVATARQAVRDGADIVVAQGVDAGGHQFAAGSGTIGFVPEAVDAVKEESTKVGREVLVVAAGGMCDGRGLVAAMSLGAEAAVYGTRFVVANESAAQDFKKKSLVAATDAGPSTVKSGFHDNIQSNKHWPKAYDGRALINPGFEDMRSGVPLEENLRRFKEAKEAGDTSRMVVWSGTGVGLVKREQPASEIAIELREEALKTIERFKHI